MIAKEKFTAPHGKYKITFMKGETVPENITKTLPEELKKLLEKAPKTGK